MRISDWSSDVCSSDLFALEPRIGDRPAIGRPARRAFDSPGARDLRDRLGRDVDREDVGIVGEVDIGLVVRNEQQLAAVGRPIDRMLVRSEEHTSELQSLMRISYAVFCLKKKNNTTS